MWEYALAFGASDFWERDINVMRQLVEGWPEGKEALNEDGKTPLSVFEQQSQPELYQEWRLLAVAQLGGV
jgi:hypothetical protein